MTTVFIAANETEFDFAMRAEKFAREAGAEVLNPLTQLPCHLAQSCYLPIKIAMLEASDILWTLPTSYSVEKDCLMNYAAEQGITIVESSAELVNELNQYKEVEQMKMEGVK